MKLTPKQIAYNWMMNNTKEEIYTWINKGLDIAIEETKKEFEKKINRGLNR